MDGAAHLIRPHQHTARVYCAGPLFNAAERQEMEQLAGALQRGGFEPFVPHRDSIEFAQLRPWLVAQGHDAGTVSQMLHEAVFALDVYQVVIGCGSLVFNMNGRVPDEGAVAEATMAWMLGKPLVLFKEDARSVIVGRDNPLVIGLADFEIVTELDCLAAALQEQVRLVGQDSQESVRCPAKIERALGAGERLWKGLQALGPQPRLDEMAEAVLNLFGPVRDVIDR